MAKPDGERNMRPVARLESAKNRLTVAPEARSRQYKAGKAASQHRLSLPEAQRYGEKIGRADARASAFARRVSEMTDTQKESLGVGITRKQLGKCLGFTFHQMQKYEAGCNSLSACELFEIARMLEVTVDKFLRE